MYSGFKPGRGYEQDAETIAWSREMNVFAEVYLTYNDDNARHMIQSVENNGFFDKSADEVHKEVLDLINHVGVDVLNEYNTVTELEPYIKECERMNRMKAHSVDINESLYVDDDMSLPF